jgi:hypothetical protein
MKLLWAFIALAPCHHSLQITGATQPNLTMIIEEMTAATM